MTTVQFTPASASGWIAFATDARVLLVGATPDAALVEAVWSALGGDSALQGSLDLLTSRGLSATPPFALLDWSAGSGSVRVIVRGDVGVALTGARSESLSGAGVSTWIERVVDGVTRAVITVDSAVAAVTPPLPLVSGVAWVASLTVAVGETAVAVTAAVAAPAPVIAPAPVAGPATTPVAASTDSATAGRAPATTPVAASTGSATAGPATLGRPPATPPTTAEIDLEATVTDPPTAVDDLDSSGEDSDFGDTMYRSVAGAAARVEPDDQPAAEASAESIVEPGGDHDGHTVLSTDIEKLRGRRRPKTTTAPAVPAATAVTLVLSNGAREPLTQPILVGRSPSVSQVSGDQMPRLITIGGSDQDISRTHARFALEGDTVVVTDLHSRNGTTIAMPGREPQKLRAGEPTSVIVGTVVDLGGGVTVTVNED